MQLNAHIDWREYQREMGEVLSRLQMVLPWLKVTGQRVAKTARNNARGKGGRRFWRQLAQSIQVAVVSGDSVSVHTDHVAARQKQFGGVIEAKNAKALTIPIADEAKGKRASEFEGGGRELFVIDSKQSDTLGILGYADGNDAFHALYALRRRTRPQQPDPFWPADWRVAQIAVEEGDRFLRRALA